MSSAPNPSDSAQERAFEFILGVAALLLLLAGCLVTLWPFLYATLWAAILCYSTWPIYRWLLKRSGGRRSLAALVMTLMLVAIMAAPFGVVGWGLAGETKEAVALARAGLEQGLPELPAWAEQMPVVGPRLRATVQEFKTDPADRRAKEAALLNLVRRTVVYVGRATAHGVVEICLSLLIGFFLFRDGDAVGGRLGMTVFRLAGEDRGSRMLQVAQDTLIGVVYGVLGTALMHAVVIALGLWIAGVPGVLLLAFATFVLSLLPFGPILVWLPAVLWLLYEGAHGSAIFLFIWALSANLLVDSMVRPLLISRGGTMPLVLVILGVLGGAAAFGFIGLFLGPTLLAIGYALLEDWSAGGLPTAQSEPVVARTEISGRLDRAASSKD